MYDYRTYKLVRMSDLRITEKGFSMVHESAETILRDTDKTDTRTYTDVILRCKADMKSCAMEYLKGKIIEESENGDILMGFKVVEKEHFWFGTLLSMGDRAEVLAPEHIRNNLLNAAQKIAALYNKQ